MNAAEAIRNGRREKLKALEIAGLNNRLVEMVIQLSATGESLHAGNQGERRVQRLTIKPNPIVAFRRVEVNTQNGIERAHDVSLDGAFPEALAGLEQVLNRAGAVTASVATAKAYVSPKAFRDDVERADYFLIDGEKYEFRAGGYLDIDARDASWKLKLLRTNKQ